jgi:Ran GTPase-activating protein (RanGAP) involved in mRNA processing and transport
MRTATPTLRDLTIIEARSKGLEPMVAALANAAWLSQVRALRLLGLPINDADLVALVTSARLEHLDTLKLEGLFNEVKVTRKGLAAALAAPEFRRLRELAINKVSLKVPGARCFATASHAGTLERLRLSDCKLGSEGTRLVLESEALPALTNLSLRNNMLGDGEPVGVGSALARTLRRLELSLNGLEDAWVGAFVAARPLAITHLALRSNRLSIAGVRMLIEAGTLPALESLSVSTPSNDVPKWGRDLESLVELPGFARIRAFDAYMTDVTSAGTIALARSPHVRELRHLKLSFNAIGPSGVEALATSEQLGNLECLELDNAGLGDDGIERLCASERLQKLRYLHLSGNKIGERGYAALSRTAAFPMLRVLRLYEAKGARRVALEQHLGAIVDVGEFTGSMGRWLADDFDM